MRDALSHGINIVPPILNASGPSWRPVPSLGLVAGWREIPGIGEKTAHNIAEFRERNGKFRSWQQLQEIRGIGPKTVEKMYDFATSSDPFGLKITEQRLDRVRKFVEENQSMRREWNVTGLGDKHFVPTPTHNGAEVAAIHIKEEYGANAKKNYGKGPRVVYMGIVRERNMQDAVENRRSRTGEEAEDILASLYRPDLLSYCSLRCIDTTEEEVYIRVNRFVFPRVKKKIQSITVGRDVVICVGQRIAGFGTPVMADEIYIIDPDD
jgi:DNA polymerase-3 subunit alpha